MASMMGPTTLNAASGQANPNAPKRPPQAMQTQYGAPPNPMAGQRPPTFSTMQQNGQPRPAPPQSWYNYTPGSTQQTQGFRPPQQPNYGGPPQYGSAPYAGSAPTWNPTTPGSRAGPTTGYTQPQPPQSWQPPNQGQPTPQTPQTPQSPQPGSQYGATPSATTQAQNTANQLGGATQNLLLQQLQSPNPYINSPGASNLLQQQLANPSPLGSQAYQTQAQQAQTQLNEQYQQQQDAINSSLASRGVYDSSIAGGYLSDLNTAQGRQMASIQANLLPQEAQLQMQGTNSALGNALNFGNQYQSGISSALANSLGYGNQQFGQSLSTAQMNLLQQAQNNGQLQQMLGLTST